MHIRHTTNIQAYIKDYTSVMLEINDMREEDCLYHFMKGLQGWVQVYLLTVDKLHDFWTDRKDEENKNEDGGKKHHGKFEKKSQTSPRMVESVRKRNPRALVKRKRGKWSLVLFSQRIIMPRIFPCDRRIWRQ